MSEDLNTAKALPVMDTLLADKKVSPADRLAALADFVAVLGLPLDTLTRADLRVRPGSAEITEAEIEAKLEQRKAARAAKDFPTSDAIRDELAAAGVEAMDGDPLSWDWRVTI